MSQKALIIIDLQKDYFPGGKWELDEIGKASENAARLIKSFRAKNDLVIHVRHEFVSDSSPFFNPGSVGAAIHDKVKPIPGELVVLKNQVNSFQETNLKEILTQNNVQDLVICGAMSHMCVDATTRAATDLKYECTLIHDACATRDLEFNGIVVPSRQVHAAHMAALSFAYANLVSTDEFLNA